MNAMIYLLNVAMGAFIGLGVMLLFRIVIMLTFGDKQVLWQHRKDLVKAFILGTRFDLKIITVINIIPILLGVVVYIAASDTFYHIINNSLVYYYFIIYTALSLILMIDLGFFSYFNEHINYLVFGFFDDDTKALIKTMWGNYNVPLYVLLILAYDFLLFITLHFSLINSHGLVMFHPVFETIALIAFIILDFIGARGNFQAIPLGIMHAQVSSVDFINKLSINGVMTYFKALKQRRENQSNSYDLAKNFGFADRMTEAMNRVSIENKSPSTLEEAMLQQVPKQEAVEACQPHVVMIMMESFATQLLKFENKDLDLLGALRKHLDDDILLKNFVSDGQGTIESFLTLVTNLPHRPNCSNYTESHLLDKFIPTSMAEVYHSQGYETSIIYGGGLSWRNVGIFVKHQHFDRVDADAKIKENIPLRTKSYDHPWGIHDEYVFDYLLQVLNNATKPQFIIVLTTSNHPPFELPETYQAKPCTLPADLKSRLLCKPEIMSQRLLTYQYANDCAGQFMDKIKSSPLKDKIIVSMTGDHAFWGMHHFTDEELFQRFTVPFYCYTPEALRPTTINLNAFGSHKDIAATLYHLSLSNVEYLSIGRNLFGKNINSYAFNSSQLVAGPEGMVVKNPEMKFYRWGADQTVIPCEANPGLTEYWQDYGAALSVTDRFLKQL